MVETAIEVSGGRVTGAEIEAILEAGKAMLRQPVQVLDGVADVLDQLGRGHRLALVTKGDLFDQESKLARSGLAGRFWRIEILSEKDPAAYRRLLRRWRVRADAFLMVGNSLRSDVIPVLAVGGRAVHIPYHVTWAHELAEAPAGAYFTLQSIRDLPALLARLAARPPGRASRRRAPSPRLPPAGGRSPGRPRRA